MDVVGRSFLLLVQRIAHLFVLSGLDSYDTAVVLTDVRVPWILLVICLAWLPKLLIMIKAYLVHNVIMATAT